ncbi:MAG: hypothetical protein KF895_13455 [Parvibaculum sp.]|nr:hypothetical protein [Parvibaculum sp.]
MVELHQTLHGYRDGHELLASSVQLGSAARRAMLALSDLSGDGSPRGFEEYLSAYPLEEAAFYAFAKTWIAAEMPRPGCVWTHTLLIRAADIHAVSGLGSLAGYFQRPEASRIPSTLLPIQHLDDAKQELVPLDGAAREIVTRLYGQDLPILIFGDDAAQHERTCLRAWSQQWPSLRRSFAFCTGALEPRFIERRAFDLQVVPRQRERRTLRVAEKFSIITRDDLDRTAGFVEPSAKAHTASKSGQFPAFGEASGSPGARDELRFWRHILLDDFACQDRALHEFVTAYAVDVPPRRAAYRELVECWGLLATVDAGGSSLRELTTSLSLAFPRAGEAHLLKCAVLGQPSIVNGAREADLVRELLTLPNADAFDADALGLARRAQDLFRDGGRWRASAIAWLLRADNLNRIGREWADSVLAHLSVDDLGSLFAEDRNLFGVLLRERPALAKCEGLWLQPREVQRAAVSVLPTMATDADIQDAVTSIVAANAASLVPTLSQVCGPAIVVKVVTGLGRCRSAGRDLDEWQWGFHLRGFDAQLVKWLEDTQEAEPWTLAFVVALLGFHNRELAKSSSALLVRHLKKGVPPGDAFSVDYAAYCLTLALRNFDDDAGVLAVASFPAVHEAAMGSRVSRRAWQWLGPELPRPGFLSIETWDEAEKLRRALVDAFIRHDWNPHLLGQALQEEQARRWVVRYCASFERGRSLLLRAGLEST